MTATSEQTISVSKAQKNDAEMSRYIQRANDQREFWLTNLVFSLILFFDIHKIFCTKKHISNSFLCPTVCLFNIIPQQSAVISLSCI